MNRQIYNLALIAFLLMFLTACQTVTISPEGHSSRISASPDYSQSKSFFLFGLIGEQEVDVIEICGSKKVVQMQTQFTFLDGFLGLLPLVFMLQELQRSGVVKPKETGAIRI